ncbi:hypothetical protein CCHL11_06597 [Colletotrichum chlorophyti]|uniref:Uncharacterized protein n=1 Tax=Colletotrichum chlorophyti TaxID=708187 RepID=A0A1Q8RXN3_9PEZI|nr:hypothetical protein CCHL11_06597 [Colletotrichum chlorophyti]
MAPYTTSPEFINVYESDERDNSIATASFVVNSSTPSAPGDAKKIKATLPEYHTAPPWRLLWDDLMLFIKCGLALPMIVFPLWYRPRRERTNYPKLDKQWVPKYILWGPIDRAITGFQSWFQDVVDPFFPSGEMDELYPSMGNLICLAAHGTLIVSQLTFLLSLPFVATLPFHLFLPYVISFVALNYFACYPLNAGTENGLLRSEHKSWPEAAHWPSLHPDREYKEEWIFLNGVSVGKHWLQGNLNRLSRTFHRPITGVHNKTSGIIFDTIQCLLERCFYFGTTDTRKCYALIAAALNPELKREKVVLILHSQGGLQGSLILDWLLAHYSRATLKKLEIYTFGNAANHFNNPEINDNEHVVGHIEHYGNAGDFVSQWGVLHFKRQVAKSRKHDHGKDRLRLMPIVGNILGLDKRQNTFFGRVFINKKWGHMLNQHYLDRIFPLNADLTAVEETKGRPTPRSFLDSHMRSGRGLSKHDGEKVWKTSKLWKYINGKEPEGESSAAMVNGDNGSH